jgi:hypothetical protein
VASTEHLNNKKGKAQKQKGKKEVRPFMQHIPKKNYDGSGVL